MARRQAGNMGDGVVLEVKCGKHHKAASRLAAGACIDKLAYVLMSCAPSGTTNGNLPSSYVGHDHVTKSVYFMELYDHMHSNCFYTVPLSMRVVAGCR